MTEVTSHDHQASLISPTTEAVAAWQLPKKCQKNILFIFCKSSRYFMVLLVTPSSVIVLLVVWYNFVYFPILFHILLVTACSQFGFPDKLDQLSIAGYFDFFFVYVISSFSHH